MYEMHMVFYGVLVSNLRIGMALRLSSQSPLMANVEQILEELASTGNCSLKPLPLFFSLIYITTHLLALYLTFYLRQHYNLYILLSTW